MGEVVGFIGACLIFLFYIGVVISDIRKDGMFAVGGWVGIFIYFAIMVLAMSTGSFLLAAVLFVLGVLFLCAVLGE